MKRFSLISGCRAFSFLAVGLLCMSAIAQEEPPQQDESIQQSAIVIAAEADETGVPRVMSFSTIGGEAPMMLAAPGFGLGMGMGDASINSLLNDNQIRTELELVDSQLEQIREIEKEMREEISSQMRGVPFSNGSVDREAIQSMQTSMQAIQTATEKRINDVLLPHQVQRLEQLRRHLRMRNRGDAETLTDGELAEALDLSDAQVERIKERAKEIEKELAEEIRKLKVEAKEELFEELTPEQREKLKELLGDTFIYEQPDPRTIRRSFRRPQQTERSSDDN